MVDTLLMHDTQKLRLKLISEESKIVQYLDWIMALLKEEIAANYQNPDCNHSQLRVLGPTKAKNSSSQNLKLKRRRRVQRWLN